MILDQRNILLLSMILLIINLTVERREKGGSKNVGIRFHSAYVAYNRTLVNGRLNVTVSYSAMKLSVKKDRKLQSST